MKTSRCTSLAVAALISSIFWASASAQVEVVGNGNVGMGTASPAGRLHVRYDDSTSQSQEVIQADGNPILVIGQFGSAKSGTTFGVNNAGASFIASATLGSGSPTALLIGTSVSAPVVFGTADVERLRVDAAGNVGIGIASPATRLDVVSDGNADVVALFRSRRPNTYLNLIAGSGDDASGEIAFERTGVNAGNFYLGGYADGHIIFRTNGYSQRMILTSAGNVGIGTTSPGYKLEVAGQVRAASFISNTTTYADFVFDPDYELPVLSEVEAHIQQHGHLPGIPSEAEAREHGIDLAAMQVKLLQKIEELTLHVIRQEKENAALRAEFDKFKSFRP